jgi:ABC-type antimicrobial peptide transport system permease subunit
MFGVIVGVASVITVIAIGQGVSRQVTGQIHHLGKNLITIRPAQLHPGSGHGNKSVSLFSDSVGLSSALRQSDITTVAGVNGVAASAPLTIVTGKVTGENGNYDQGFVIGTGTDLSSLLNQSMAYGSFLDDSQQGNAAVLGPKAAEALFDEDVPLGRSFNVRGQNFVVVGIFNSFNTTPLSQETDFNKAIFISQDTAENMTKGTAPTYEILAKASTDQQTAKVAEAIKNALGKSRGGQSNLAVLQGNQNLAANQNIIGLLTKLVAGVAAISLLVGGIGIMNVMLVSVSERTHEIGIRKAVGATNSQILSQFIVEAALLSVAGATIGVALAFAVDGFLRAFTDMRPVITWQAVVLAFGVSLVVGVVFGTIPAFKAARRDPIEALRSE